MQSAVTDSECLWTFQALFMATPSPDSVLKGGSYIFSRGRPVITGGRRGGGHEAPCGFAGSETLGEV